MSVPETAETKGETRGGEIRTADLVATALTRYAQAFATFGLMALVAAAFPALVVAALRSAHAGAETIVVVGSFAAAAAALALAGAMTAFIGRRLRSTLPGIVGTALLVAPPFGAVAVLHLAAIFLVPLLLAPLGLAPVAAGAGDGAGLAACRRALELCRGGGYRRSLVPCAITASFAAVLFLAFGVALSPLGGRARVVATLIVWAAVAWPIAGLMLRSLYGALSGRLVVRLRLAD
ncbi:MAG TPA: hypothetical protein VFD90_18945 [Gaiellales bacterium]|nr:hypothetical protein [Gaiellales bacterium]